MVCLKVDDRLDVDFNPEAGGSQKNVVSDDYKRKAVEYWRNAGGAYFKINFSLLSYRIAYNFLYCNSILHDSMFHDILGKKKKTSTVQHSYKLVNSENQLYKWEDKLKYGDTERKIYDSIGNHVFERFIASMDNHTTVHDRELRRWALSKAKEYPELRLDFKASTHWLFDFKTKHSIVSRKITKFVKKSYTSEVVDVEKVATDFVHKSLQESDGFLPNVIFNTDQCGINIELTSGRSLDIIGTKKVVKAVGSVAATTHSYTIQPVISKDGRLLSPMFVCWQETTGVFGPNVRRGIEALNLENLYVVPSKSGKLTKQLMVEWFDKVYFPHAPISSILYVDSWNCFNDRTAIKRVTPGGKELKMLQIPPKTTPLVQPLDVHFFRTWKQFIRNINDHVLIDQLAYEVI